MEQRLPKSVTGFKSKYPSVWKAFAALGDECHKGPLDEKTRRLVKLGIAIAHRHEGAVHSATRNALRSGVTVDEMFHAAMLAITTIGWPASYAAMTWIDDAVRRSSRNAAGDANAAAPDLGEFDPDALLAEDPNDSERLPDQLKGQTTEHASPARLEDEGQSGG